MFWSLLFRYQASINQRTKMYRSFHRFKMVNIILIFPLFLSFSNDCEHYGGAFEVKWFLVATCVLLTADRRSLPLPVNVERPPLAMENPKNVLLGPVPTKALSFPIALSRRAVFYFWGFIQSHFISVFHAFSLSYCSLDNVALSRVGVLVPAEKTKALFVVFGWHFRLCHILRLFLVSIQYSWI